MITPYKIVYNKFSSRDFNLICCLAFDSDNGETSTYLSREAVVSEVYDGSFKRVHGYKWTESFQPKFTFVKDDFSDFTFEEQRRVLRWLTSKNTTSFLSVYYDDSEVVTMDILGGWTEIQTYKLGNNRTVGICATFESVTPYALSPLYSNTYEFFDTSDENIVINIKTDDTQSLVYPKITIHQHEASGVIEVDHAMTDSDEWIEGTVYHYGNNYYWIDPQPNSTTGGIQYVKTTSSTKPTNIETTSVVLTNIYTDPNGKLSEIKMIVKNNIRGETIILDGANKIISSNRTYGRIFGDDFTWNWLPLFEGTNTISVLGKCTVTVEYRIPIKCGEF